MTKSVQEILLVFDHTGNAQRNWLSNVATDEQVDEFISQTVGNEILHRMGLAEREKRHFNRLSKPHWTLTPTFWITVGVLIISLAILTVAVLSWLFPKTPPTPNDKPAISTTSSVSAPTNLPLAKAATQQTSPPAIYTMPGTNILNR